MDSISLTATVLAMSDVQKLAGAGLLVCLALMAAILLWKPREKRARMEKSKPVPSLQEPKMSRRERRRADKAAAAPTEEPVPAEVPEPTEAGDAAAAVETEPATTVEAEASVEEPDAVTQEEAPEEPVAAPVAVPVAPTPDWWVQADEDAELPMIFTEEQAAEAARRALIWAKVAEAHGADPSELPLRRVRISDTTDTGPAAAFDDAAEPLAGQVIEAEVVTIDAAPAEEPLTDDSGEPSSQDVTPGEPVSLDGQYIEAGELPAAPADELAPSHVEAGIDDAVSWAATTLDGQYVEADDVVAPALVIDEEGGDDQEPELSEPERTQVDSEALVVPIEEQFVEAAEVEPAAPELPEAEMSPPPADPPVIEAPVLPLDEQIIEAVEVAPFVPEPEPVVEVPVEEAPSDDTEASNRRSSRRDAAAARRRERALAKAERNARRANRGHDVEQPADVPADDDTEVDHRSLDLPEPLPQR